MKVAIVSKSPDLASRIESRITNSKYWVVYDINDHSFETISLNIPLRDRKDFLSKIVMKANLNNIEVIISGKERINDSRVFNEAGVKLRYFKNISVKDAMSRIQEENKLNEGCIFVTDIQ